MGGQSPARQSPRRLLAARERRVAALAAKQHGVVSREQLLRAGLSVRTIERRTAAERLHRLHRGVYAIGHAGIGPHGRRLAAVLACGEGALLSHRSAAELWGFARASRSAFEVTAPRGRSRQGIVVHECGICGEDRTVEDGIPITTVARTLFDFAEVTDDRTLARAFEESDRLGLLEIPALERVCARGVGRRALLPIRRLIDVARGPEPTCSPLEDRLLEFCREHDLPLPQTNVIVLGREADAFWPDARLVVEADSWSFHRHRAAFERDRARDAAMLAAGYRVVRLTHRRLETEPATVTAELRRLLGTCR
jgi:very-short-patch-repair endonuclease